MEGEKKMITVLITYAAGVPEIFEVCLASLARHEPGVPVKIRVITDKFGYAEANDVVGNFSFLNPAVYCYNIEDYKSGSEMHGKLLDMAIELVNTDYFMTLDSDCFPIASNWGKKLIDLDGEVTGILQPWIPAPEDIDEATIEYKIRKFHCYNCTQVACQLMRRDFFVENKLSFLGSYDTGFGIIEKLWEKGLKVKGLMPSRCPIPKGGIDPELNRICSVVYGDTFYHHGAATRKNVTGDIDPYGFFEDARKRVLEEKGAEWLLDSANSYQYKFDKEEEVAQFKMESMYMAMRDYLLTHDSLFDKI